MRTNLTKKHYTKPERIVGRLLQENHIPFKTKVLIGEREVDILIDNIAIEIDGHEQDGLKNNMLVNLGYLPIHFHNKEVYNDREQILKSIKYKIQLCQSHIFKEE